MWITRGLYLLQETLPAIFVEVADPLFLAVRSSLLCKELYRGNRRLPGNYTSQTATPPNINGYENSCHDMINSCYLEQSKESTKRKSEEKPKGKYNIYYSTF